MREVKVGIRIGMEGLSFTGVEEVNGLINRGGVVTSVEAGGAVMRKMGEDDENVRLTLSGCDMVIVVDDSAVESSSQTLKHNQLYEEGSALITPYMQLADRASTADNIKATEELHQGIELLNQALEIDPSNWPAHWIIGKAWQVLQDTEKACDSFGKAFELHKGNADVAREYMFECLKLGRGKKGILAARCAVHLNPEDAGLTSNLALALLIGAEVDEAAETVSKAISMDPGDTISQNLQTIIEEVRSGKRSQPSNMADLNAS